MISDYCNNYIEYINTSCGQNITEYKNYDWMHSLMLTKDQHFSCQTEQHHVHPLQVDQPDTALYAHVKAAPEMRRHPALMLPFEGTTHADILKEDLLVLHVSCTPMPPRNGKNSEQILRRNEKTPGSDNCHLR